MVAHSRSRDGHATGVTDRVRKPDVVKQGRGRGPVSKRADVPPSMCATKNGPFGPWRSWQSLRDEK